MKKIKIKKKEPKKSKEKVKKKRSKSWILSIFMFLGICVAITVIVFCGYIVVSAPPFTTNKLYTKEASVLYDRNGNEITRIGNVDKESRILVTYDDLPQVLVDALVATEDSRFFQHNGLDAARFFKASIKQVLGNDDAGGASTLTMQVAKNTYNGTESSGIKGIIRKFTDIYMAVFKIEKSYTKEEIIEFYVNSQWLGSGNTNNYENINGVEQASQAFFGKSVSDLSLPEAALLVGMFNNPSYFSPIRFPERAKSRQKTVLNLMVRHGYITEEEAEAAGEIPIESLLVDNSDQKEAISSVQAFIDFVVDDVTEKTGNDPREVPMAIYTTLDTSIQEVVTQLEKGELYKFVNDKVQNGIAVTSTVDGSILALGPGRNYVYRSTNRATERHQIGSTAKIIFDYGPLIEFNNASTGQMFIDEEYTYSTGGSIKNYDGKYVGLITMEEALIDSRNIPALQAFQQTTLEQKEEFAHSLGIDYGENLYESASIGGFDPGASPLEMSAAYAAFGRGGYYIEPYSFTKIVYLETEKEYTYKYTKTRVMSEETAYMINSMLTKAGKRNVGGNINVSGTDVATKGGTTTIDAAEAKKLGIPTYATPDHWNIAYTPDYTIALRYGYDTLRDGYLTSTPGSSARKAIMAAIANRIFLKNSKFTKPSSVVEATVEFGTIPLQLASEYTPDNLKVSALFKAGTEPTTVSNRFSKLANPTNGNALINGASITLTWNPIATPDALDTNSLQSYFNENYFLAPEKYYNERISYNNSYMGSLGYQVYLEKDDGTLISLGYTNKTSFVYEATSSANYTFVIKSSYSIFKNNMSSGLKITANLASSNLPSTGGDDNNDDNQNQDDLDSDSDLNN